MGKYNKVYNNDVEFLKRMEIFKNNMVLAAEWSHQGSARYGATEFADMTPEEFAEMYLMPNLPEHVQGELLEVPEVTAAASLDWRTKGAVTPVKNQGQCGSCWAFSATETIESYFALSGNALTSLSMEQVVDCDTTDQGCNGGLPSNAYNYVNSAGGLDSYADYPYTAGSGQSGQCSMSGAQIATVPGQNDANTISGEQGLYQQASSGGPVSVCVDATTWQQYQGGVISSCTSNIDHCVQLTGYAQYGQQGAYWIVRNSWNTSWGENGFIWVEIGQDLCAIGDEATIVPVQAG
jgi:cysteine peptidase B